MKSPEKEKEIKARILKLPCGHESVEIPHIGDHVFECSVCHHKYLLTWGLDPKIK